MLEDVPRPTAVFAATDLMAMKLYAAAAAMGLEIPGQLSVVGYADFPFAEDLVPALTTVRQDPYHMGTVAARILLDRVLQRSAASTPQKVRLKPQAVIRASTAPPQ
jgi:LacI family transcriptional regulator